MPDVRKKAKVQFYAESEPVAKRSDFSLVYILCERQPGAFYLQALASSITARVHHPDNPILWLCPLNLPPEDQKIAYSLVGGDFQIIIREAGGEIPVFQSRLLKLSLSEVLKNENFCFLDSDTIIKGNLSGVFLSGMALNACRNVDAPSGQDSGWHTREFFDPLGWPLPSAPFVNSGVMAYSRGHDFAPFRKHWRELWEEQVQRLDRFQDQPALNLAIQTLGEDFGLLPDIYNNQLLHYTNVRLDAKVHHFLGRDVSPIVRALSPFTEQDPLKINWDAFSRKYRRLALRPYPYRMSLGGICLLLRQNRLRWLLQLLSRGRWFCNEATSIKARECQR